MNAMFSIMSIFMIFFILIMALILVMVLVKVTGGQNKRNSARGTNYSSQDNDQQMFMNQMLYQNDINLMAGGLGDVNKDSDHDGIPDIVDQNPYTFDAPDQSTDSFDNNSDPSASSDMDSSGGFDTNTTDTGSFDTGSFDSSN